MHVVGLGCMPSEQARENLGKNDQAFWLRDWLKHLYKVLLAQVPVITLKRVSNGTGMVHCALSEHLLWEGTRRFSCSCVRVRAWESRDPWDTRSSRHSLWHTNSEEVSSTSKQKSDLQERGRAVAIFHRPTFPPETLLTWNKTFQAA